MVTALSASRRNHGAKPMSPFLSLPLRAVAALTLLQLQPTDAAEPAPAAEQVAEKVAEKIADKADAEKKKTVAELLKDTTAQPGLFGLHQNKETGELYLQLKKDQT